MVQSVSDEPRRASLPSSSKAVDAALSAAESKPLIKATTSQSASSSSTHASLSDAVQRLRIDRDDGRPASSSRVRSSPTSGEILSVPASPTLSPAVAAIKSTSAAQPVVGGLPADPASLEQHDSNDAHGINPDERRSGTVKFFSSTKGFGFILDSQMSDLNGEEVFVHYTSIDSVRGGPTAFKALAEGETVEYTIQRGGKGWQAQNVTGPNGSPCQGISPTAIKSDSTKRAATGPRNHYAGSTMAPSNAQWAAYGYANVPFTPYGMGTPLTTAMLQPAFASQLGYFAPGMSMYGQIPTQLLHPGSHPDSFGATSAQPRSGSIQSATNNQGTNNVESAKASLPGYAQYSATSPYGWNPSGLATASASSPPSSASTPFPYQYPGVSPDMAAYVDAMHAPVMPTYADAAPRLAQASSLAAYPNLDYHSHSHTQPVTSGSSNVQESPASQVLHAERKWPDESPDTGPVNWLHHPPPASQRLYAAMTHGSPK